MPTTRSTRSVRRAANKRTILSALDENNPSNDSAIPSTSKLMMANSTTNTTHPNHNQHQHQRPFHIPKDLDCTSAESIHILIQDIEKEVKRRQESIVIKCCEATSNQLSVLTLNMMKIESRVKNMTIGDFNKKYMTPTNPDNGHDNGYGDSSNNDNNEEKVETDIVTLMKSLMSDSSSSSSTGTSMLGKKRFRGTSGDNHGLDKMELETPMRLQRSGYYNNNNNIRTPATILRTAKRGEMLLSANGSPIEQCQDGALVATVSKKRRANGKGIPGAAPLLDINVGVGGKVISLSDPNAMSTLSNDMKNTVTAQLNVLQDQISRLMTQIEN